MAVILGLLLGVGMLLLLSPLMWPATELAPQRRPPSIVVRAREHIVQAGLGRASVTTVTVVSVIVAIAAASLALVLVPVGAIALAAGAAGLAAPWMVILWRARLRRRAARVVWPDVVDHLVSAVRSGLALPDSVVTLSRAGPEATRSAFAEFERNYRASGNFSGSLDRLKDRLVDPVADRIIETLRMSREVGGSELTTVLRNLASYLRQDAAIRAEVEARQSWVVNAARLGVAAPWLVLVLLSTRPEAAAAYNTSGGATVIVAGVVLSVVAYRLMLRLGRLPQERRWFE